MGRTTLQFSQTLVDLCLEYKYWKNNIDMHCLTYHAVAYARFYRVAGSARPDGPKAGWSFFEEGQPALSSPARGSGNAV